MAKWPIARQVLNQGLLARESSGKKKGGAARQMQKERKTCRKRGRSHESRVNT